MQAYFVLFMDLLLIRVLKFSYAFKINTFTSDLLYELVQSKYDIQQGYFLGFLGPRVVSLLLKCFRLS